MTGLDLWRRANEVDLVRLAASLGLELNTFQNPVRIKCPFHVEGSNFNLTVHKPGHTYKTNHYHCHSCGWTGTAIDLVRSFLGMPDREAVQWITGRELPPVKQERQAQAYQDRDMTTAFANAALRLHGPFGGAAREYLLSRGLEAGDWQQFMLGLWADDGSTWANRITIPHLRLPDQTIIAGKGRSMDPEEEVRYRATKGGAQNIYLLERALELDAPVVLCEGEIDAISLHVAIQGAYGVCALPGVNNFKDASPFIGRIVYVVVDPDAAGERAINGWEDERGNWHPGIPERLADVGAYPHVIRPQMKDLNEMLVAYGRDNLGQWFMEEVNRLTALV